MAIYTVEREHVSYSYYTVEADSAEEAQFEVEAGNYIDERETGIMDSQIIDVSLED